MDKNSLFRLCSDVCRRSFPGRKWWEENLPYVCIKELGMLRSWYQSPNGTSDQLKAERGFQDGKSEGIHRIWYEDGQLRSEQEYKDGKPEGIHRIWYENGQLGFEEAYKGGKPEGIYRAWNENGQLKFEKRHESDV